MTDRGDLELLREYADHRSQPAFSELVRRYVDLVWSSAVRQVGDPHAAEDITQVVFIVLTRKAGQIRAGSVLPAWLLGVTRFASKDHLKRARRRRRHEQAAAIERTAQMVKAQDSAGGWSEAGASAGPGPAEQLRLAIVLDDALARLSTVSREALVLRFFQNQSFKQVGERLGITEVAARQRVFRGLERLRNLLGRRGVSLAGESLAVALASMVVLPAPGALGASVAAMATSAGGAAQYAALVKGTVSLMTSNAKTVIVAALLLLVVGVAASAVVFKWSGRDRGGLAAAAAPVKPSVAPPMAVGGGRAGIRAPLDVPPPENYTPPSFGWVTPAPRGAPAAALAAYDGPPITGTIKSPDGQPLSGAELVLFTGTIDPRRYAGPRDSSRVVYGTRSRADGTFMFRPRHQPQGLFVKSAEGYAWVLGESIKAEQDITLTRWGRVELTVKEGANPVSQARVMVNFAGLGEVQTRLDNRMVTADQEGRATFDQVPAGEARITLAPNNQDQPRDNRDRSPKIPPREIRVNVGPGKTHKVALGGVGRPVVGTIDGDVTVFDYRRGVIREVSRPKEAAGEWDQVSGPIYFEAELNGWFGVTDMPPGDYEIEIDLGATQGKNIKIVETYAVARATFKVPAVPGGFSDQPLDIGKVAVTGKKVLEVGQPFPKLAGKTATGQPISIQDFHGQVLFVQVGDGASRSRGEIDWQHSVHARFGHNPAFAMLTITRGADEAVGVGVPWPVMRLDRVPEELEASSARMFLVDADGHVAAKNVTAAQVYAMLDRALEGKADPRVKFDYVPRPEARTNPPFDKIPGPSETDAANGARGTVIAGVPSWDTPKSDANVLTDGRMPAKEDAPAEALFFQAGTLEGRFRVDLNELTEVAEIRTYSWHKDTRAAQVYRVYGSDGTDKNFDAAPGIGVDPTKHGWTNIAFVDTRPDMKPVGVQYEARGGRYVSSILDNQKGMLGKYRHLLFQVFVTEADDVFGHTFYGEIDVIPKQ